MIEDVTIGDVRELVRQHALDLVRLEPAPEAGRHGDGRVLGATPGRERVRDVRVDHGDPRLREIGHRAQPLDHGVQLRRFFLAHDLRAGGCEGELVGGEVLEDGEPDDDQEHRNQADVQNLEQDYGEAHVQRAEQRACEQHPEGKTGVATVGLAFHRKSRSLKWIALIVASAFALAAGPASAGVALVATPGEPLRPIVVPGLRGLVTSTSTRIPGLIAATDLDHRERLGALAVPDAAARVARLQRRFEQLHDARRWAYVMLAALTIGAILLALWRRTGFWRRFCVAIAPVMVVVALLLALAGAARPEVILPFLGLGSIALAAAIALPRRAVVYLGPAVLLLFFVVLWAWPETAGFSSIGPRPEQGGRFYGVNNLVETVLLAISLISAAELGLVSVLPIAALGLVTIGWSRTGADGGGLIVFAAAFAFLALRLAGRITVKRLAVAGTGRESRSSSPSSASTRQAAGTAT